jgi:tetratricopeptide (TPR) repeat protein
MSPRLWLCAALMLGLFASPARADEPLLVEPEVPTARQHFVQGNRLYRVRKFDEAITAYQAGALIEPAPIFDFNLGQCYRQLGRYTDALWHYERFLRNGPPAELRGLVTKLVQQVRAELVHKVMVQPPPDVAAAPGAPHTGRSAPSAPTADGSSSSAAHGGEHLPWYSDAVGWTLLGGGVLGAGSAGVLLATAFDLRDDASSSQDEVRRTALQDAARVRRLGSAALGIGSAVLIATGAIKLAIHASEQPRPRAGSWSLGVSPRGVAVLGRF